MCAALTHYVAGSSIITGSAVESPEMAEAHTIWNVLVAALQEDSPNGLAADSGRRLRLALAAALRGGYQPADLGGSGFMARLFDGRSRALMGTALSGIRAGTGAASVNIVLCFTSSSSAVPTQAPLAVPAGTKWDTVKERARQAKQNVNPVALQHGIESVRGALTEAKIAKIDKNTGKLKIGVTKAALRSAKTMRRALDGASVTGHLKSFNESSRSVPPAGVCGGQDPGRPSTASSTAEFASYVSKRDYLRDWARRPVVAAGVPPTEQLVMEHADMAAIATRLTVFQRLGTSREISDLSRYFGDEPVPAGTPLDTFDAVYEKVAQAESGRQVVAEAIVGFLDSCWTEWIEGIRDRRG